MTAHYEAFGSCIYCNESQPSHFSICPVSDPATRGRKWEDHLHMLDEMCREWNLRYEAEIIKTRKTRSDGEKES